MICRLLYFTFFASFLAPELSLSAETRAGDKGIVQSTLSVVVLNEFDRPLSGVALTLADESITVTGTFADGAYTFPPVPAGTYALTAEAPFFVSKTAPLELANSTESTEVEVVLDDAQFPDEILDNYRVFDTDLNGEIGESEFTAVFANAQDAYLTFRDRCECNLTTRNIAALFGRPFLGVTPVKSHGEGSFPVGAIDFGEVVENATVTRTITLSNDGGGQLTGNVTFESHGDVSITTTSDSYELGPGNSKNIKLELTPHESGAISGLMLLSGNYDGQPVPLGISADVVPDSGEGEGEGEGEPVGCSLNGDSDLRSATADPFMIGVALLLLLFPRRAYRGRG